MTTLAKLRKLLGTSRAFDCREAQEAMSAFIDSMTSPDETNRLEAHVAGCAACRRQLQGLVSLRNFVARVSPPVVPEDLNLEVRIRLSHARTADVGARIRTHLDNVLKPHAVPALTGVLATCLCFVALLGSFGTSLHAPQDDVSVLWLQTHPRAADPLMFQLAELGLDRFTVDLAIDRKGKAFSTVIVNGPEDPVLDQWLRDVLLLGEFHPATIYGQPVQSRLILSFVGVRSSPLA